MTTADPPYLRIVEDVRRRIASGELRPGDRVPSARQMTRDWGVAIATATKALATLQHEGLTTVRPGVGTVVVERPLKPATGKTAQGATEAPIHARARRTAEKTTPRPSLPARRGVGPLVERELTRHRIVQTAIMIADREGMAELSMRRIAAELDVATMSLYRHVPNKDDLILFMIDMALGEERFPARRPAGWRARLELCARLQWKLFRRHPWLAPAMSLTRPQLAPNALAHTEWMLDAFDETGVDLNDRMYIHVMLFSYVRGVATAIEPEAEAERATGLTNDEWMQAQEGNLEALITSNALASFIRLTRRNDFDLDLLFEFGLARLLDGIEVFQTPGPPVE